MPLHDHKMSFHQDEASKVSFTLITVSGGKTTVSAPQDARLVRPCASIIWYTFPPRWKKRRELRERNCLLAQIHLRLAKASSAAGLGNGATQMFQSSGSEQSAQKASTRGFPRHGTGDSCSLNFNFGPGWVSSK